MRWGKKTVVGAVCGLAISGCAARSTLPPSQPVQVSPQVPPPLRILTLGDSITQGRAVTRTNEPATQSWRYPFWRELTQRHVAFDMVGGFDGGFEGDPSWPDVDGVPFDKEHESQWGHRLDEMTAILRKHLDRVKFDVVLVLLGGNDLGQKEAMEALWPEWEELLSLLRHENPRVGIVVGLYCGEWEEPTKYREELRARVPTWSTPESRVVLADGCDGWVADPKLEATDTTDWVHPNAQGDLKLARGFLRGLEALEPELSARTKGGTPTEGSSAQKSLLSPGGAGTVSRTK